MGPASVSGIPRVIDDPSSGCPPDRLTIPAEAGNLRLSPAPATPRRGTRLTVDHAVQCVAVLVKAQANYVSRLSVQAFYRSLFRG